MTITYTCAMCGGTFQSERDQDEAKQELRDYFGDVPLEACNQVCDPCWQVIKPPPASDVSLIIAMLRDLQRYIAKATPYGCGDGEPVGFLPAHGRMLESSPYERGVLDRYQDRRKARKRRRRGRRD